jgi:hypothetical protein
LLKGVKVGKNVPIFAGLEDDRNLRQYIESEELRLVPMRVDLDPRLVEEPGSYPAWYISFHPLEELHPYGSSPPVINCATDPLIEFTRSYYEPPYLIAGRIYWSDDNQKFGELTKRSFAKLAVWVRKHWSRREEDGFYIGPEALRLVREEGAIPVYFPPGTPIEIIRVR